MLATPQVHAGMPILEVDRAKSVVVPPRQRKGFSGLRIPFHEANCKCHGDAKEF
jgi:NAD/NADP transhydrogenase beta subunit